MLVETQDKALRRISELREQCSLEQQAKAHLESALRLDMDEQECVIKTLKTKLSLLGENPDEVLKNEKGSLIDIDSDKTRPLVNTTNDLININEDSVHNSSHIAAGASIIINESEEKIRHLESQVNKLKESLNEEKSKVIIKIEELSQLNKKFEDSQNKIRDLLAREEDNNILLAENKLMIHTELENKERELKSTKHRLLQIENEHKQLISEKDSLNKTLLKFKQEDTKSSAKMRDLLDEKKRMDQKVADFEKMKGIFETDIKELQAKAIIAESERQTQLKKHQSEIENAKSANEELQKTIINLNTSSNDAAKDEIDRLQTALRHIEGAHAEISKRSFEQEANIKKLENSLHEQTELVKNLKTETEEATQKVLHLTSNLKNMEEQLQHKSQQMEKLNERLKEEEKNNVTLQHQIDELHHNTEVLESEKAQLITNCNQKTNELQVLLEKNQKLLQEIESYKIECTELNELKERLETLSLDAKNESKTAEEFQLHQLLIKENEELKGRISCLTVEVQRSVNEKSESNAFIAVESSIKNDIEALNDRIKQLQNQLKKSQKEKDDSASDISALKTKVDTLKNEKKDLEKTLEKEIRDKTELQNQVTNILQEIGRLENQLKEVKQSHADIENEKRLLQEKTQKLKDAQQEAKVTAERERTELLADHLKDLESKVKNIECDNSQLAEKNCLLEEANTRLQNTIKENKSKIKELNDQVAILQTHDTEVHGKLKEANEKLFNLRGQMDREKHELTNQLNNLEIENQNLRISEKAVETKISDLAGLSEQFGFLQQEKDRLTSICDSLKEDLDKVRNENEELVTQKNCLDEKLKIMETELAELHQCNVNLEAKSAELLLTLEKSNDEREVLRQSADELRDKLEGVDQIKIENEFLNKSSEQTTLELSSLKDENAKLQQEVCILKEKAKSQQCELYVLEENKNKQIDTFQQKNQEIEQLKAICHRSQTLNEEMQTELKQQQNQFDSLKLLNDGLQKDISTQEINLQKLQTEYENLQQMYASETALLKQEQEKHTLKDNKIQGLQTELERMSINLEELESKLNDQEKISNELSDQSKELVECKEKVVILQKEIDSSRAIINDLNKDLNSNVEKLETIESQNVEHQNQISALQSELATKNTTPDNIDVLRRTNEQLQYQLVELRHNNEREVIALNHEIDELRENAIAYLEKQRELDSLRTQNAELSSQIEHLKSIEILKVNSTDDNSTKSEVYSRDEEVMALKKDLEKILSEVQDVSNRNLFLEQKCENYLILEQSNERLKLQNSKLSQQLDETLVRFKN